MKWQSTWKYFVRSAAVALVHPCTRDISAPARQIRRTADLAADADMDGRVGAAAEILSFAGEPYTRMY